MRVSVIGSYRRSEETLYHFRKGREPMFRESCHALGASLAEAGHVLLLAWSSDNAENQRRGGRHPFEDTADYHALLGYLAALRDGRAAHGASILLLEKPRPNFHAYDGLGVDGAPTLAECVRKGWIQVEQFEETAPVYRSHLLESLAKKADLVVAIGGGKATKMAALEARERDVLQAVPFFGGIAERYLRTMPRVCQHWWQAIEQDGANEVDVIRTIACIDNGAILRMEPCSQRLLERQRVHRLIDEGFRHLQATTTATDLPYGPDELLTDLEDAERLLRELKGLQIDQDPSSSFEFILHLTYRKLTLGWGLIEALAALKDDDAIVDIANIVILHELVHVRQKLLSVNYFGIGRAGVVLEQVDYMADAFAIRVLIQQYVRDGGERGKRELPSRLQRLLARVLQGIATFDRAEQGNCIDRLSERRLRRYLTWHFQYMCGGTVSRLEDAHRLLRRTIAVEIAPLDGKMDPARHEKVVVAPTDGAPRLYCAVNGRLRSTEVKNAADYIEQIRRYEWEMIQELMKGMIEAEAQTFVPWVL